MTEGTVPNLMSYLASLIAISSLALSGEALFLPYLSQAPTLAASETLMPL